MCLDRDRPSIVFVLHQAAPPSARAEPFQGTIQALHRHSWREMRLQNRRGQCVILSLALGPGLKLVPASDRPLIDDRRLTRTTTWGYIISIFDFSFSQFIPSFLQPHSSFYLYPYLSMARLKPLCPDRTSSEGCPLGVHCRLRHRAEPGEDDEIEEEHHNPILADANRAANGNIPTGHTTGQRRCFNFWNTGSCRYGAKCDFDHVANLDVKPRIMVSSIQPGNSDDKIPTPFPSLGCLDDASSAQLLISFPKNMRCNTIGQVRTFLTSAKRNRSINNVIQAESLLLAITSSSPNNNRSIHHSSAVVEHG